jgi:hypothetical protein
MHEYDLCCIGTATRGLTLAAPVMLAIDDRRRHLHVMGKTGTGKTTLLKALMYDDLRSGRNFALLDPLGGLAEAVIDAVPKPRNDEVIYFDPSDLAHPIGFNPLDRVAPDQRHLVADHLLAAFAHIWGASLEETPRLLYVLYNGIRLLLDTPGSTLLGLPRLLVDDTYRTRLLAACLDPVVAAFWENEFAAYDDRFRAQVIAPVQNKVGMLLAGPIANIVGQRRSTIDIPRLMNEGGVLVANLGKGKVGAVASHLLGAFLTTTISQAADARSGQQQTHWPDFTLYADEVQNFATERFAATLSEGRNGKLMLVVAHQYLEQLPRSLQHAILANCGSFVTFRIGSNDTRVMAAELGIENAQAPSDTANFHAWVKLLHNGVPSNAFYMATVVPEPPEKGRSSMVRAHTRARHTRDRQAVERTVRAQMRG